MRVRTKTPLMTAPSRRRRLLVAGLVGAGLLVAAFLGYRAHASAGLLKRELRFGDRERSFYVRVPPGHSRDRPAPLVIALHGGGGSAVFLDSATGYSLTREADSRGWVLVLPQGVARGWNDGRPPVDRASRARAGVDDVGFILALIDDAQARYGIDTRRVFVTGISNGGAMALRLALDASDRIAAIAPVTMSLPRDLEGRSPERAVSVLLVNGTLDPIVPYAGGQIRVLGKDRGEVLSTPATVDFWAKLHGCTTRAPPRLLPDVDPADGTRVSFESRSGCADGARVALYAIDGGGHTWPSGQQYLPASVVGRVSRDLDATRAIFDFFAAEAPR